MSQRHKSDSTASSLSGSLEESDLGSGTDLEKLNLEETVLEDPLYYILANYLETENGKNIATVLEELVQELRSIREAITSAKKVSSS